MGLGQLLRMYHHINSYLRYYWPYTRPYVSCLFRFRASNLYPSPSTDALMLPLTC